MSGLVISTVECATATATRDIGIETVITAIRTGGKNLRGQIEQIRNKFEAELAIAQANAEAGQNVNPLQVAKLAASELKKQLPAGMWCGQFSNREEPAAEKLQKHSGLLCADLDSLGPELETVRAKLKTSSHVFALFLSPSGNGLKAVIRVSADASKHADSYRAVEKHIRELTGVQIDEKGKDIGRLCFMSYDPELYVNENAIELEPLPEPEKPKPTFKSSGEVNLSERQRIASEMFGDIEWNSDTHGFLTCPGKHLHTERAGERDCEIHLDGAPNIFCFHKSCKAIEAGVNHELQSRIGKAENVKSGEALPRKSAATELCELAEGFEFFHDSHDRAFVRLKGDAHPEIWPVESTKFRKRLARMYYKEKKKAINRNALADAITTLAGGACYDGPEEPVFLRVAPYGGDTPIKTILIDLCDERWRVIKVTPDEWQILDASPVAFFRTDSMKAFPEPVQGGGSIAPLWDLLNVTKEQRPLVAGALLNAFHPFGPYFVVNFVGEHGAAKSCAAQIFRQLIDPNQVPLRSPPKEENDLFAQSVNNRCVALDNLSYLPSWLSDALCRVATGGGLSKRTLYTDTEETSLKIKRPVILNGIEDVAVRPDLADRAMQIELETISNEKRKIEEDLWPEFEKQRATIFSAILDALVCALRELPGVQKDSLPRMADAARWAMAGETALGFERGTFIAAYTENLNEGAIASLEAHPVGVAIGELLEAQAEWSGTSTKLLEALNALVTEEQRKAKNWPENARALGHALRRLAPAMRRAGISFDRDRSKSRIIQMCKVAKKTSRTSTTTPHPASEPEKNDDVDDVDDVEPPTNTQRNDDVDDVDVLSPHLHVDTPDPDGSKVRVAPKKGKL